jgi:hypothetical protein
MWWWEPDQLTYVNGKCNRSFRIQQRDYFQHGLLSTLQVFGAQQQGPSLRSALRLVARLLSMVGKAAASNKLE